MILPREHNHQGAFQETAFRKMTTTTWQQMLSAEALV
jgi:hypothetical protein